MGSITKRGANSWLLKYELPRHADGKRNQKYETVKGTKTDAKERLAEITTQLKQGTFVTKNKISLSEWLEKWLTTHAEPHVTPKTFERYVQLCRVHIIPNLGSIQIQKLSIPDIQAFYAKLHKEGLTAAKKARLGDKFKDTDEKEGLSPCTIRHVHRVLSMALSEAVRGNEIFKNPAKDMKLPRFASKETDESGSDNVKAFTKDQLMLLLEHFKGKPMHLISSFAVGTGMRQGEILALRWDSIDFERNTLTVKRAIEDTKEGQRVKTTKSRKIREINLEPALALKLKKHRKEQIEIAFSMGMKLPADTLVFPRSPMHPTKPMVRHGLSRAISAASEELGFQGHSFHSLRHTFASLCLTAVPPVPLTIVSKCLGHANPGVTASIYSHFIGDESNRAASAVSQFLGSALGGND